MLIAQAVFNGYTDLFYQAETLHNKNWFEADSKAHGHNGPILTAPHDPAPISERVLGSFQSKGLPYVPDMFTTGESAHGCGHAVRTILQGIRTTAADYVTGGQAKNNIQIKTDVFVDKVILDDSQENPQVIGVQVQSADGATSVIKARREVILSAGAYGSPAILLRSGIGPKAEIEQHATKSRVDLPGVGKNLMDHMVRDLPRHYLRS